jgi:predicted  nucleic acid-binding Zn-ribbon protein
MKHECTRCGKVLQSVKMFDRHGRYCTKKSSRVAKTNPRASEDNTRHSPKRARIGSPDKGNGEPDKDDPDDQNVGGPDISIARDVSYRLLFRLQTN